MRVTAMADSSDDDEPQRSVISRPQGLPDLAADSVTAALSAAAKSSSSSEGASVKRRIAEVAAVSAAHSEASEALDPHIAQLEDEMEQLSAILSKRFDSVRDETLEKLEEFRDEADFKFETRKSEGKKWAVHIDATDKLLQKQDATLDAIDGERLQPLEKQLE
eukprot:g4666.t1